MFLAALCEKKSNDVFFWSTHSGAEVDLLWQKDGKSFAAEIKYSDAPKITKSMLSAMHNLNLEKLFVVYPGNDYYKLDKKIEVVPIKEIQKVLNTRRIDFWDIWGKLISSYSFVSSKGVYVQHMLCLDNRK